MLLRSTGMEESSQKLFRLPGTIEEEEEEERKEARPAREVLENALRAESPLLGHRVVAGVLSSLPRNVTLVRVSTQSSSIAGGVCRQDSTRSRYRAGPTRKLRRRAVLKNGDCNVLQSRISRRSLRFLQDIFTTLVDTQWRWTLLCFILSFFLSWLGFAVIWWLIAFTHGDFEERHLPPFQVESNWTPCVYNIFSFTSCFLFSIETQHTIGYGSRSTTEECPEAIFVMCIQSISGVMIQAFMVGIVFAKMTRPKQRTQTLLFSRNAVICQRDGELCLMFRVGDMRKSHIIGATVRAQVIRNRTTKEGEVLSQNQQELQVGTDGQNGDLFFIWPTTIIHRINEESPFYSMSAEDMLTDRFEVVLILEGTVESTGQTTQARSSYLPQEILWGHRFDSMVSYSKERQGYEVDYSLFDSTTQVDTPLCSGKDLSEFYRVQDDLRHGTGVLIDENSMERRCWCQPIVSQRRFKVSLVSPDTPRSHDSAEDEQLWRNAGRVQSSSCNTSHGPQIEIVDPSRMFDFDANAIQVMDDLEFEHLPEAVNREILKNSQEITFEDEEEVSSRAPLKLHGEGSGTLRSSREVILEEEEGENVSTRGSSERNAIGLNARDISKICQQEKLPLVKVEENREDARDILQMPGRRCRMKNKRDHRAYLERKSGMQDRRVVPTNQDQKIDLLLDEQRESVRRLHRDLRDDPFVISNGRFFTESGRNAIDRLTASPNRDEENPRTSLFPDERREPSAELNVHFTDDSFTTNDGVSFGEAKSNAINTKDYEMRPEGGPDVRDHLSGKRRDSLNDEKALEQPERNAMDNMRYMKLLEEGNKPFRGSLALNRRPNGDFLGRENGAYRVKRYDKIRVESEKKRPGGHLAKIIIQRKLYPADFRSLVSPLSDLSPESGFCEGNLSNLSPEYVRRELLHLLPRNSFQDVGEVRGDGSSSGGNLSQRDAPGEVGIPGEGVQVPIVELPRHACDDVLRVVDGSRICSRSDLSRKRFVDEDDEGAVKCTESRTIEASAHMSDSIDSENGSSSSSNLSYRHFFHRDDSASERIEVPFNCVDSNSRDVKQGISSDDEDSSGRCAEDLDARFSKNVELHLAEDEDDVVKGASAVEETITRMDNGTLQDVEEARKRSFPSVYGRLFNDSDY